MKPFKLIIFDWDGTLIDSGSRIVNSLMHVVRQAGVNTITENQAKDVIGLGLREVIEKLLPGRNERCILETAQQYREHYTLTNKIEADPFEGVEVLLTSLQQAGYQMAIATGKGRSGLDDSLDVNGFHDYFVCTRCAGETFSKPHPQMILDILETTGVDKKDTVMVGDTVFDMEMANNADISAIAVSYGVHEKHRLMAYNPLACLDDIRELPQILQSANKHKT